MRTKRKLKIINFLYLSDQKYNQIREYRNQQYVRDVSLNSKMITKEEHKNYKSLLATKEHYFAFLVTNDGIDYGVITLKKISDDTFFIGEYLVKEEYQYEGGGVANRFCILYLCKLLNIKYLQYEIKLGNTRGHRAGFISQVRSHNVGNGFYEEISEVLDYDDEGLLNSKARKLFDKVYEIIGCQI